MLGKRELQQLKYRLDRQLADQRKEAWRLGYTHGYTKVRENPYTGNDEMSAAYSEGHSAGNKARTENVSGE